MESIFENDFINYDHHYSYEQFYPNLEQIFTSKIQNSNIINMLSNNTPNTISAIPVQKIKNNNDYFLANIDKLLNEFKAPTNKTRRQQFRNNYNSSQQKHIKHRWVEHLNKNQIDIPLLDYVEQYYTPKHQQQKDKLISKDNNIESKLDEPSSSTKPVEQSLPNNSKTPNTTQNLLEELINKIDNFELKQEFKQRLNKLSPDLIPKLDQLEFQASSQQNLYQFPFIFHRK